VYSSSSQIEGVQAVANEICGHAWGKVTNIVAS
jgi:pyruvate/oxaloacetate carboxyltransferase